MMKSRSFVMLLLVVLALLASSCSEAKSLGRLGAHANSRRASQTASARLRAKSDFWADDATGKANVQTLASLAATQKLGNTGNTLSVLATNKGVSSRGTDAVLALYHDVDNFLKIATTKLVQGNANAVANDISTALQHVGLLESYYNQHSKKTGADADKIKAAAATLKRHGLDCADVVAAKAAGFDQDSWTHIVNYGGNTPQWSKFTKIVRGDWSPADIGNQNSAKKGAKYIRSIDRGLHFIPAFNGPIYRAIDLNNHLAPYLVVGNFIKDSSWMSTSYVPSETIGYRKNTNHLYLSAGVGKTGAQCHNVECIVGGGLDAATGKAQGQREVICERHSVWEVMSVKSATTHTGPFATYVPPNPALTPAQLVALGHFWEVEIEARTAHQFTQAAANNQHFLSVNPARVVAAPDPAKAEATLATELENIQ